MIRLTEVYFSKESISFEQRTILVDKDFISTIRPNKITMRAPSMLASHIFGDNIPDEYYKVIASTECTTIRLKDKTFINVAESVEQIEELTKKK